MKSIKKVVGQEILFGTNSIVYHQKKPVFFASSTSFYHQGANNNPSKNGLFEQDC